MPKKEKLETKKTHPATTHAATTRAATTHPATTHASKAKRPADEPPPGQPEGKKTDAGTHSSQGTPKGQIKCTDKKLVSDLQDMRNKSRTLDSILNEVTQKKHPITQEKDLTIHLREQLPYRSCYDKGHIYLDLKQPKEKIKSDLVMEVCNAHCDVVGGLKPSKTKFSSAADYAQAVEKQEWSELGLFAVKPSN